MIYDDTSEAAEELDRSNNVSDGKFDMAKDERVAETVMGEVNLRKQEEDIAGESTVAVPTCPFFLKLDLLQLYSISLHFLQKSQSWKRLKDKGYI